MLEIQITKMGREIGGKESVWQNKILKADNINDIFYQFYQLNRELRYCNGCYWTFNNDELKQQYLDWRSKNETIEMFYGGNVYD